MNKKELEDYSMRLNGLIKQKDKIIKELHQKINKAIKYLKEYQETQAKYCYVDFDNEDIEKLLKILGDKE